MMVAVIVVSALIVAAVPVIRTARQDALITNHAANLQQLVKAMYNYCYRPSEGHFPAATGSRFWLCLYETGAVKDPSLFMCPLAEPGPPGTCHYLGPSRDANLIGASTPIGCCRFGDHGIDRIVWIGKSGDAVSTRSTTAVWHWLCGFTEE
jgi:hypothetical protein